VAPTAVVTTGKMPKRRELLIILILAALVAIFFGYFIGFPFQITEPVLCIQMIGARCSPKIHRINALLDFLFWFVVLAGGWWVLRFVWKKTKKKK